MKRFERFLFLHQSPGNNQHLGCQFQPNLGLNAFLLLPALEFLREIHHKVLIADGCYPRGLIEGIAKICIAFLGKAEAGRP